MRGRPREPIDLIIAKGKKHLTEKEIEERREAEVKVPFTDIKAPEYLKGKMLDEFNHYAEMLSAIGIFTELDVECLARYVMSQALYLQYTNLLTSLIKKKDFKEMQRVQSLQDRAFKQAHTAASSLGLTITSRCKLSVPQVSKDEDLEL